MDINVLTHKIFDSAYKVHTTLSPGLLESAYKACLVYELKKKELFVDVVKPIPHYL
ncbi:GxxExxY protein [Tenuifilum sp.]|uniref:GxxExxY protein n=1 Tax=Tenuifilum sp. TaxID=2760880 RepID=UPI00338FA663